MLRAAVSILLLAALTAGAQERKLGTGVNFYSKEKEAALGAQLAQELERNTTALDRDTVQDYVKRVGLTVAAQLPDTGVSYTFHVIMNDSCNSTNEPFALPGGFIFVPAKLILAARNEAELAGMLAHAVAHVADRHATRQATRGELENVASTRLIYMGGGCPADGEPWRAIPMSFVKVNRGFELVADRLAVQMIARAGYDPEALVRYIGRVQAPQKALSSLPPRDERIARMEKAIKEIPRRTYSSTDELPRIQDEVRSAKPNRPQHPPSLLRANGPQPKQ